MESSDCYRFSNAFQVKAYQEVTFLKTFFYPQNQAPYSKESGLSASPVAFSLL